MQTNVGPPLALLLPALLLAALITTGCGADDTANTWTTTRDTLPGGIARVVNVPPDGQIEPTWLIEEELRIGTREGGGAAQFGQIKGIAVLSDGQIAVLDAQAREVRLFAPDGSHLATYGRAGQGPGELEDPWGLMRSADDRLWVPDHRNDRMTVYDPGAGFVTSYPLPVLSYGFIWAGAMLEDGRIVKPSMTLAPERRELLRIYGPDMALADSILLPEPDRETVDPENPPNTFYWEAPGGMPRGYMGVPFYPHGASVFDPSGHVWTSGRGDAAYRIARSTLRGDTTLVIETRRPPVPVPESVRDSAIDAIRTALRDRGAAGNQDWSKIPTVKPAVEHLFVADDGRLWVRTPSADSLVTFDVHERDGSYAGTAVTGIPLYPWISPVVRGDAFWAVVTDEYDVQYVVRGRLSDYLLPGASG